LNDNVDLLKHVDIQSRHLSLANSFKIDGFRYKLIFVTPFNTTGIDIVEIYQRSFSFRLLSDILPKRFEKFFDNITRGK